jgi:class 3 adenylate cyclase
MINHYLIEQTIATVEAHQAVLGQAAAQTSLAALRQMLTQLEAAPAASTALALKGERKHVTVMFADISGFTAMSEKLDPEEVRGMINGCFERLGAVIDRYGGHIDKFIGDEIMALFGAPQAHENDPERALRAALEMMLALDGFNAEHAVLLPKPLALHFGINSGLVIAGGIGTAQRQDYSVMGDTVNLAARLEDASEAGEILVGEDTYRLTAPLFEFEPLKPMSLKGKEKPVQIYRLLRTKAAPGQVRGIAGLYSPMVGRDYELGQAQAVLANFSEGRGGLISVVGEAGLGKSRLITELGLGRQQTNQVDWAIGRALSYGESASYLVAREVLRSALGVGPEAATAEVGQTLRAEVERLFAGHTAEVYPYLAHLLETPLDESAAQRLKYLEGEALHQRILQAVRQYLQAKTRQQPLVMVWEDLHWGDPSSLELLEFLLPLTQSSPLLLILIYRPAREQRIWAFHQRVKTRMGEAHRVITLSPLTYQESSYLLDNLLESSPLPPQIRQLILNKAEGNPFYIEEVIRSLIDSGGLTRAAAGQGWVATAAIGDIAIPDSLQGVIMARIDRLDPETKRVLQVASVIGRTFPYQLLADVVSER